MKRIFLVLMSLKLLAFDCAAQTSYWITHTQGLQAVAGNLVEVITTGKPATTSGLCGDEGYWIGYNEKNSVLFKFEEGVSRLQARLMVINPGELIALKVNGKPFAVTDAMIAPYSGDCLNIPVAVNRNGLIGSVESYSNIELNIAPGFPVHSLAIEHTNGDKGGAGCVVTVAIVDKGAALDPANINGLAGDEAFSLLPNPATEHVDLSFLVPSAGVGYINITDAQARIVYQKEVASAGNKRETLNINISSLAPGSYFVELTLNDQKYVRKLTKL